MCLCCDIPMCVNEIVDSRSKTKLMYIILNPVNILLFIKCLKQFSLDVYTFMVPGRNYIKNFERGKSTRQTRKIL